MNRRQLLAATLASCASTLSGCAAPRPPEAVAPAAPHAIVNDQVIRNSGADALFFFVHAIDGKALENTSLSRSLHASRGTGRQMNGRQITNYPPPGKVRLGLTAKQAYAAPIDNLLRQTADTEFRGTIDVELKEGETYFVQGVMDAYRREIWLVDANGQQVGPRIVARPAAPDPDARHTCCNLRYEGDWISDANWHSMPMIPAGARIVIKDYGRHRAHVEIDGRPLRIGLDYGRKQSTIEQFMAQIAVRDDPRPRIAGWPPAIQQAVGSGRVIAGMTREQVIVALGYPRLDRTASLEAATWTYLTLADETIDLQWAADGRLAGIAASAELLKEVQGPEGALTIQPSSGSMVSGRP